MGISQSHVLGRSLKFFAAEETTRGTFKKPVAADAVKAVTASAAKTTERRNRNDSRQTRSLLERITGKSTAEWSYDGYLIPSGTAGTAPDARHLLRGALGKEETILTVVDYTNGSTKTVTIALQGGSGNSGTTHTLTEGTDFSAATSNTVTATNIAAAIVALSDDELTATSSGAVVTITADGESLGVSSSEVTAWNTTTSGAYTYRLSKTQVWPTASLVRHYNDVMMETVFGAWVDSMTISVSGGDEPKISCSGSGMGYVITGTSTLNGAMSSSATMVIQTADSYNVSDGSVVKIGTDDNSGAGYEVTVDTSRPSFTIESAITASDAATVVPFAPSETTAGSPVNSVTGSLTVDAVTFPITSFDVTVANEQKAVADEAFQDYPDDVIPGYRGVSGTISIRARKDFIIEMGDRNTYTARDVVVTLGSGAGTTVTINMDTIEVDWSSVDVPEAEEGVITLPYVALATSSGEDELNIVFS